VDVALRIYFVFCEIHGFYKCHYNVTFLLKVCYAVSEVVKNYLQANFFFARFNIDFVWFI